ncbi:aminotransferase class V-fold PLP-dependent enzyme [[Limnothrix rosea] IAM M-220]|uniref:aminotransferase class V-fold PLP-dependent enzyme n=1 Tax=[Limnothrix rosea] IAM M-220 TaxID=454133 RepID=UPI0009659081|nr:aminotransferase class V-fold PLP-dependent enzyme [[Limnothrix rosea] IAM M-220]OKH18652.1 cysteine lyase [[Limnothrix rosea] IAM M-220]
MAMDLEQLRLQFPAIAAKSYFNFGGQGPLSRKALNAIISSYDKVQVQGPFSIAVNAWAQDVMAKTKAAIASELRVQPKNLVLTENVTMGCNIALWGIEWQEGDEILVGDCEHPGIIGILQGLVYRFGVKLNFCPIFDTLNEGDPTEVITQALTPKTRCLVISHLLWNTGQVLPLKEICQVCHDQDVQVMVDAAQSVGGLALNLEEMRVDFYAFTGHKWCCGPAGVGGLYVSEAAMATLRPTFIGWRGVKTWPSPKEVTLKNDGNQYEVATSAYPLQVGLTEAIALHQSWGTSEQRYAKICEMSAYTWERLNTINAVSCLKNSPPESGLVSFVVDSPIGHKKLVEILEEQGFCLRTLTYPDCIRACTHYFTTEAEIDAMAIALESLL